MSCTQKCWVYQVLSGNHNRPRRGQGWRKGGDHLKKKVFSRAIFLKKTIFFHFHQEITGFFHGKTRTP
jgi:hypothetical protein